MNKSVNAVLNDSLTMKQEGNILLVLQHDVYENGADLAKNLVRKVYGPERKVDIVDASSSDW
jgi:hypothetical protein